LADENSLDNHRNTEVSESWIRRRHFLSECCATIPELFFHEILHETN
jgi:hypothetical protein